MYNSYFVQGLGARIISLSNRARLCRTVLPYVVYSTSYMLHSILYIIHSVHKAYSGASWGLWDVVHVQGLCTRGVVVHRTQGLRSRSTLRVRHASSRRRKRRLTVRLRPTTTCGGCAGAFFSVGFRGV